MWMNSYSPKEEADTVGLMIKHVQAQLDLEHLRPHGPDQGKKIEELESNLAEAKTKYDNACKDFMTQQQERAAAALLAKETRSKKKEEMQAAIG